jgi:hypothetical protein
MTTETSNPEPATPSISGLMDAIVELVRAGARPEVLQAQSLLLQRLVTQGDVFPGRIPAPLNITEIGGYLNLLEQMKQPDLRSSAIASALGIAGPAPHARLLASEVPVGFVELANHRPEGDIQKSIPTSLPVRADFSVSLATALARIHEAGCHLPLKAPAPRLTLSDSAAPSEPPDDQAILAALGRQLEVFPGTVLIDPTQDALVVARLDSESADAIRLVARKAGPAGTTPTLNWISLIATDSTVNEQGPDSGVFEDVAHLMADAGWYHPETEKRPTSLKDRGALVRFHNVTALLAGETQLGEELALLYPSVAIARSAFAAATDWIWDGQQFRAPGGA